jgi:hypothetical protein
LNEIFRPFRTTKITGGNQKHNQVILISSIEKRVFRRYVCNNQLIYMGGFIALFPGNDLLNEPVTDKKVELARHLFVSLESQFMLADRKVQAVFGLKCFSRCCSSLRCEHSLNVIINNGFSLNRGIDPALKGLFLACVCIATSSAVKALSPWLRRHKNTTVAKRNHLSFLEISNHKR